MTTGRTMYNLFQKRLQTADETPILCAVPDGGAIPAFLRGAEWRFEGKVGELGDRLPEADRPHFEGVIEATGHFLFPLPDPVPDPASPPGEAADEQMSATILPARDPA